MSRINKLSLHRLIEIADTLPGSQITNHTYHQGDRLFEENTYTKGLFYLERGTVLLSTIECTGAEVVVSVVGANNFMGFLPILQKTRLTTSAVVLEDDSQIKFIPKAVFTKALEDNRFVKGFIKILSSLITSYENQLVQVKNKTVRERLADVLIALNHAFKKGAGDPDPMITLKKKDLASMIGVAPETLSRRLAEFEKEGLVELHIKGIKVKDKEQLLALAG
jgi:CRP-like cAMP-binding protein